jgi:DNA-directed RNA polymerase subunit RPC12/RpoP
MTKCYDCGTEDAHYLSRRDAEMRCWRCMGIELDKHKKSINNRVKKHES